MAVSDCTALQGSRVASVVGRPAMGERRPATSEAPTGRLERIETHG